MRDAVDYTSFLELAKANLTKPGAIAWLSTHNITKDDARRLELGFFDPKEDDGMAAILNGIYEAKGEEPMRSTDPLVIVPCGRGYWIGISTKEGLPGIVMARAGAPEPWTYCLYESEGEPVIATTDIKEALAFAATGASVVSISSSEAC